MAIPRPAAAAFGLSRRLRVVVQAILAAIALSGGAWLAVEYMPVLFSGGEREARAVKAWSLKLHGAAAMGVLVCFGWVLSTHVGMAWRTRCHRVSGAAMVGSIVLLGVSGYGLYYASDDM